MAFETSLLESQELIEELLDSDAAYFRAAAESEHLAGFRILHMPGIISLAAACVAYRATQPGEQLRPGWVATLEKRISDLGYTHARFYQRKPDPDMQEHLGRNGYRPAGEIAMMNTFRRLAKPGEDRSDVVLHQVCTEQDWVHKVELHRRIPSGPDGHASAAETWVEMERRKCDAGYMEPYLIVRGDEVCGAVNFAPGERIGRLKNIVIHPDWRRKGIGEEGARLIAQMAKDRGKMVAGCFAMKDGKAVNMYRGAGYVPVAEQTEWYREL